MTNKLVFIVEDEAPIQELIAYNLTKEHYSHEIFSNAEEMLIRLEQVQPAIILLDTMLPGIDGL